MRREIRKFLRSDTIRNLWKVGRDQLTVRGLVTVPGVEGPVVARPGTLTLPGLGLLSQPAVSLERS